MTERTITFDGLIGALIYVYIIVGLAVGATWPVWMMWWALDG